MCTATLIAPKSGTVVWLRSLATAGLNGKIALAITDLGTNMSDTASQGQCNVLLLDDNSITSVGLDSLSLCPPSKFRITAAPGTDGVGVYATQDIAAGMAMTQYCPMAEKLSPYLDSNAGFQHSIMTVSACLITAP